MNDIYNLRRFVDAQSGVFDQVVSELTLGRKRSHWMWFIFPQIRGLGHSAMAERYAISSRAEAAAYTEHEILGPRLRQCTRLVIDVPGRSISEIFGYPDDLKFRSSMTLFHACAADNAIFGESLKKYFAGEPDAATLRLLVSA